MKVIHHTCLLALSLSLCGCSGMKFRDASVNADLPNDWKNRSAIANTADFRFHLAENVGLLLSPTAQGKYEIIPGAPILPDAYVAKEEPVKDGAVYSSRVTGSVSSNGGLLAAAAASLAASQAMNYQIVDVSTVYVPMSSFPAAKVATAASAPNPTGTQRLWVQQLILSRIVKTFSTEIKCDASGAGPAFKVGASCYDEEGSQSNDFAISAVLIDIDKWTAAHPSGAPATSSPQTHPPGGQPTSTGQKLGRLGDSGFEVIDLTKEFKEVLKSFRADDPAAYVSVQPFMALPDYKK